MVHDTPCKHCAMWKKSYTKVQILYGFVYIKYVKWPNIMRESILVISKDWVGKRKDIAAFGIWNFLLQRNKSMRYNGDSSESIEFTELYNLKCWKWWISSHVHFSIIKNNLNIALCIILSFIYAMKCFSEKMQT